ncbi:carboxypeptidase B [Halyomorpha halys]|uniref:carboxypeptidase B n=1 Tax=Halyomorpha halys TaxID=286706 RepID=UPI0006D4DF45|nr:carboxypeptidase B [Halyomorpha halys]
MLHISYKHVCLCLFCFFTCVELKSSSEPNRIDRYMTFDEINKYLDTILANNNNTKELIIGKSNENRDIRGIEVSNNNGREADITILLDGGIHAREWVSTVAVLYTINQLLENSSNSDLITDVNWYIFPMLNPDGYVFTMEPNGDRLWRKNRGMTPLSACPGVDLNRNFDFQWGGPGASDNPCDPNYAGPFPFSEPESRALANFILDHVPQIKMYLTLHTAAQAIIYPWGFTTLRTTDWKDLDECAKVAATAISEVNGTIYTVGPTTDTVGPGAGGSDDWAKGVAKIKYVYTFELPGLNHPQGGFGPLESSLAPMIQEAFVGIKAFVNYLKDKKYIKTSEGNINSKESQI